MPKGYSKVSDLQFRFSPYSKNKKEAKGSGDVENKNNGKRANLYDQEKNQWEESLCPICIDHPHQAVLLICSSRGNGCRPYLCNTSCRLSNCFDQFCKMYSVTPLNSGDYERQDQPNYFVGCGGEKGRQVLCPLCRGQISGWMVVERARDFLDKKERTCPLDSCEFSGNYYDLSRHAEREHPNAIPYQIRHDEHQLEQSPSTEFLDGDDDFEDSDGLSDYDSGDEEEVLNVVPLRVGETFLDHCHFGPIDEILTESITVSDGILHFTRTTTTGITYTFTAVLRED